MDAGSQSKIDALEWAFEMQCGSSYGEEVDCYISKKTGEIVHDSEAITGEPCPVQNIGNDPSYCHLPDKFDLDLGQHLVWNFVDEKIPALEPKIREIFSRRGAYRRWKGFLDKHDLLDQWYSFENKATRTALLQWSAENGVPMEDQN
jgi:hypothetical protein